MKTIDTCGEKCPVPILKAKKALSSMETGEELTVLATDPSAVSDFNFFGSQTGNAVVSATEKDGIYTVVLRRK